MSLDYPKSVTVGGPIAVRLADDSDAEVISSWTEAPEVSQFWGGHQVPLDEVLVKYTGRRAPEVVSYVITEVGRPVGYLQAWQVGERFGLDMFLSVDAQGRGIGSRTARAMAMELTARGWTPLTVDPAMGNPRAVRAWRAAGFVPSGELGTDDGKATQIMHFSPGEAAIREP